MRKLKLQVQISIDGFVSTGPDDEQHWVTWQWQEIRPHVIALSDSTDTILIGRKLAVDYIPYWQSVYTQPGDPMHEIAVRVMNAKKVVLTKTLERSEWENTVLAKGDLAEEVNKLKRQEGKDIIVYGGASFVSALIREGLIDEYHLFVNPVAIGRGGAIFGGLDTFRKLSLKETTVFPCGIVKLHYQPL
ncbi:dihydrofolate reductase family protein [Chitinophaga sp. GCM10012297]|uniref:Dihydrofolate reductase family protein n=1 Tax=Chitinophaga chungangae TaxID=2821488 RepID=A0ABS3YAC1_9BACT|nr:dihydrofolate reductase family protein [Chitinophaga chungangae]MBO9151626.1 dihydrofolate reductase family protein [Chitinophaga chungangae]